MVAATAELQGLALPHPDRDFECSAAITGQALRYGPGVGKWARDERCSGGARESIA